jgi:hypothetical protein
LSSEFLEVSDELDSYRIMNETLTRKVTLVKDEKENLIRERDHAIAARDRSALQRKVAIAERNDAFKARAIFIDKNETLTTANRDLSVIVQLLQNDMAALSLQLEDAQAVIQNVHQNCPNTAEFLLAGTLAEEPTGIHMMREGRPDGRTRFGRACELIHDHSYARLADGRGVWVNICATRSPRAESAARK